MNNSAQQPFISATCRGERCACCGAPAVRKVGEEIPYDDPLRNRHNLTAYVCAKHFAQLFGGKGAHQVRYTLPEPSYDPSRAAREQAKDAYAILEQLHFSTWERAGFQRAGALLGQSELTTILHGLVALDVALHEAGSILYSAGDQLALLNKKGADNPWTAEIEAFLTKQEIKP
ncbi:hypothetical protein KIKIMORA_00490 [Brevundimonas phage vB_BpoS-Kikimora]|uniref:Uncharacterized protein n=1 Tax=Brevundimonas phage vB_BpoS-Kikimora TaxID=2948601 RepID=A0A9E7MQV4_9CAUD|nr:hypothetical protein KIKIMORA_00490 [Brevundimonas phage vB_BpoS-Kikimora]